MTKRIASGSVETHGPSERPAVRKMLQEVVSRWHAGESPNAHAAIERNPDLANVKSVVIDLAYEEYCLRLDAGETIDREAFCAQFPDFRTSLCRRLEVHDFFAQSDDLQGIPEVGETICGLTLIKELGRGALGCVFLAHEVALGNRPVAVKFAQHGQYEAEFLGRLRHPNIVPVFSVKSGSNGLSAVVMPYLGGNTLSNLLDAAFSSGDQPQSMRAVLRRLNEPEKCNYVQYLDSILNFGAQLADALAYTHSEQILHRDLKPSNVLLAADGRPMLMDFNLSSDLSAESKRIGGTLLYMSPEQIAQVTGDAQAKIDHRADIYSLGVVLWELLTGRHPFFKAVASKNAEVELRSQQQAFDPFVKGQALPKGVANTLARCLAYSPDARFAFAADLAVALRRQLRPYPRAIRWVRRRPKRATVIAFLFVGMGMIGAYAYATRPSYAARQRLLADQDLTGGRPQEAIARLLNVLLEEPASADVHFLLGRARLQTGDLPLAYEDFNNSYQLSKDGKSAACLGYLTCILTRSLESAKTWHERARNAGFHSPEMENNDGYCRRLTGDLDAARQQFEHGLAQNPKLSTAILNLSMTNFNRLLGKDESTPSDMFNDALQNCPPSDSLFHAAALATLNSDKPDPDRTKQTVELLEQALAHGARVENVRSSFETIKEEPSFKELLERGWDVKRVPPIYLSDPLGEFPAVYPSKYD